MASPLQPWELAAPGRPRGSPFPHPALPGASPLFASEVMEGFPSRFRRRSPAPLTGTSSSAAPCKMKKQGSSFQIYGDFQIAASRALHQGLTLPARAATGCLSIRDAVWPLKITSPKLPGSGLWSLPRSSTRRIVNREGDAPAPVSLHLPDFEDSSVIN